MNTGQKYRYFHYSTLWDFQNVNHKGKPEQPILGMIYKNESCVLKKKKKIIMVSILNKTLLEYLARVH